jgi:hypothetical protein
VLVVIPWTPPPPHWAVQVAVMVTGSEAQPLTRLGVTPVYVAVQWYVPAVAGLIDWVVWAVPAELIDSVSVKTAAAEQLASLAPKSLNTTLPLGAVTPVTVAVSETAVPTVPPADWLVVMAGVDAVVITTGSSAQADDRAGLDIDAVQW